MILSGLVRSIEIFYAMCSMRKCRFLNVVLFAGLVFTFFFVFPKPQSVYAQSCGGSVSNTYTRYTCDHDINTGLYSCVGQSSTVTGACGWQGNSCQGGANRPDYFCNPTPNGCNIRDSTFTGIVGCSVSGGPTPTPGGGGGQGCGACNTCVSSTQFSKRHVRGLLT